MKKIITILTAIATCASMSARMMFYTANDVEFYLKIVSASAGTISADGNIITFASRAEAKGAKLVVQEFIKADSSNPSIQQVGSTFSVNDKSISLDNGVSYSKAIGQEKEYTLNGNTVTTDCFVSCFAYANKRKQFASGTGDATWVYSKDYTWYYDGVDQMTIIWASSFDDPNYDNSTETAHFQGDASDAFPFTQFEATIGDDVTDGTYTIDIIDSWEHAELGTQNGTFINVDGKNKILVTNHPGIKIVVGDSGSSTDDPGNGGGTDTTQFPIYQGDEGTEAKPYLIKTIDDLNKLSADVNSGTNYSGKYFKLESDLDYSDVAVDGGRNFTPIGWAINSSYKPNDFYGNFDGGDHTISGVKVEDNTHDYCGLFGSVTNGTIKNLTVTKSSFLCSYTNTIVGGIVGDADNSTFENCHTTSDVTVTGYETGGIVGNVRNSAKVIACTSAAAVKGAYVGGILGNYKQNGGLDFELKYCFYYGSSVTQPSNVGDGSGYGALYGRSGADPEYCYYQSSVKGAHLGMDIGTSQHGYTITLEDGITMSGYATEPLRTITLPSGDILNIFSDGYSYLGQRYFRYGATVTLSDDQTVDDGYTPGGYINTDGEMGPVVDGSGRQENYSSVLSDNTLTMGTCDVTISMLSKTPTPYTITYDLAGGTVTTANPATYNVETDNFTLTNPTKTGYDFAGWKLEGSTADPSMTVTIPKGSLGDRTYTATWTITTYNITYDLAGGTVATANPTSYTVETDGFTLNNPTRDGYDFRGWQGTDIDNLSTTVIIAKGSTGNRTYTALWKPNSGSGDWSGHVAEIFEDINTDANTLSIASEAEMALFAKDVSSYAAYTVMLTKDLDLKDYLWKPIDGFNGTFDGQGHKISGVMIESTDESQGLFGTIGTAATVKNLVIANSSITGGDNTGAVVGRADFDTENIGTIENCHVLGDVIIAGTRSNHGGIAGYGKIIACTSAAIIRATDTPAGGIVGSGDADKCLYYGTILPAYASTIGTLSNGYATNYQTYDATTTSHKYVHVYDADPGIMGTATEEYSNTGYKVYEKGVSYGGKFYTAVVAMTEDGITNLTAYAGQEIDVAFGRSFDALGTSTGTVHAATICLPFSFAKPETSVGKFYTFGGVTGSGDDYTVTMTEVSGTEITAGTPYMFVPAGSGAAVFENTAFPVPAAGFTAAGKTENGGWAFTGTYTEKTWESGQTRLYGFAGTNFKTGDGSALNDIGAFQRFGYGTTGAFRCYLMAPEAAGTRGSATALPETMRVVLKGADGSTTAIGTIDTRSGEAALDGNGPWYTLSGQRLQGKPAKAGLYIHNNKKVVIK